MTAAHHGLQFRHDGVDEGGHGNGVRTGGCLDGGIVPGGIVDGEPEFVKKPGIVGLGDKMGPEKKVVLAVVFIDPQDFIHLDAVMEHHVEHPPPQPGIGDGWIHRFHREGAVQSNEQLGGASFEFAHGGFHHDSHEEASVVDVHVGLDGFDAVVMMRHNVHGIELVVKNVQVPVIPGEHPGRVHHG